MSFRSDFERDGFVVMRQFLSADELAELNRQIDRFIRLVVPTLDDSYAFYDDKQRPESLKQMQHMTVDPYFRDYGRHPAWVEAARSLVDEEVTAMDPEWFNKPPGTNHVTPPHQDNYYFCLKPPNVVTLWMALDPVDDENGCLRYVAGSHHDGIRVHGRSHILGFSQGILDYGDSDREREVPVHLEPGDVVAHHGNTIHRADANRSSTRNRRAFAIVYRGNSCRRDEAAFERYQAALKQQHQQLGLSASPKNRSP